MTSGLAAVIGRGLWSAISSCFGTWHDAKTFIEHSTNIAHDTLHLMAGTAIWLGLAIITRRSIHAWFPLAATFAVILFNETVDLWVERWPSPAMQYGEGAKDILTTMAIPVLFAIAIRLSPRTFDIGR